MDEFRALAAFMEQHDSYILTHVTSSDCATGKMAWLQKWLPRYQNKVITVAESTQKVLLATSSTTLVDDNGDTIDAWRSVGGFGILVPRRWNFATPSDIDKYTTLFLG